MKAWLAMVQLETENIIFFSSQYAKYMQQKSLK